jgi:hypothetical protein
MTAGSDALGFREECLLLQLKCDLLETPEIAKILCNVYKGSYIAKYPLKQLFTMLALNVRHRSKTISVFFRLVKDICDLN